MASPQRPKDWPVGYPYIAMQSYNVNNNTNMAEGCKGKVTGATANGYM